MKKILSILVLISLSGCSKSSSDTQESKSMINYNNPKTVCLGKISFQIPSETEINYGDNFTYNGIEISVDNNYTQSKYDQMIKGIVSKLRSEKHETEGSLLKEYKRGSVNYSNIIISREHEFSESSYIVNGYVLYGHKLIELKSEVSASMLTSGEKALEDLINNISLSENNKEIPKSSLCWKDIRINVHNDNIPFTTNVNFTFPSYIGVRAEFDHRVRFSSDASLLELTNKNISNVPSVVSENVSHEYIRKDLKIINQLNGEEYIGHISPKLSHSRGYEVAVWQYLGKENSINNPYINFRMENDPILDNEDFPNAEVNQKQFIQLFDFISNSIVLNK